MIQWGDEGAMDDQMALLESQKEFKKDSRRVAIKGFPDGTPKTQIEELLRSYDIETIHMDKNGTSCKVVFADEQQAKICIAEIEMHGRRRGWYLEGKNTASDFMICVSHFPLEWDEANFKTLIKDYGETEKCFLVRSKFLDSKSMGYGFLEFTSKSSAIIARNELHGKQVVCDGRNYRVQVHWIDRIPAEYEELQSCTIYCQLPEEWQITVSLSDQLREFLSVFDLVYFDIAELSNENRLRGTGPVKTIIAIAEYDTAEQAALTVKKLRTTNFPRFGEPLQIMFSLPQYGAAVLLKSFEIFHNKFLMEKLKHGLKDSLLSTPRESDLQRCRTASPKQFQLQAVELARQTLLQQQQQRQIQQIQLSSTQKAIEAQLLVQAAQTSVQEAAARQLQQFTSLSQPSHHQLQQQQRQQLLQQQFFVQQQQNNEFEKMKRFNVDQVRFGSSGMEQRFQHHQTHTPPPPTLHQHHQAPPPSTIKPKLDLLSEHFTEQKLSQKLFNHSSYSPSPQEQTMAERERELARQFHEQKLRDVSYELEMKKLDFDRKQMMRRRFETYAPLRQHSIDSMSSSLDQYTPEFHKTPPRMHFKTTDSDTKDSPKSLHLLGSLLVNTLADSPQRMTPWSTNDNETPSKDLAKSLSALGNDWTPEKYTETARKRRFMNDYTSDYDKRYQYNAYNQATATGTTTHAHMLTQKLG